MINGQWKKIVNNGPLLTSRCWLMVWRLGIPHGIYEAFSSMCAGGIFEDAKVQFDLIILCYIILLQSGANKLVSSFITQMTIVYSCFFYLKL